MKIEYYEEQVKRLPETGKKIIGQLRNDSIVFYQAYKPAIAEAAIKNQRFGGGGYKFERMSWIKPGFLWMMYRSGWATKTDQERILSIEISISNFMEILKKAVHTTYKNYLYSSENDWKTALQQSNVRIQWDPDHTPNGQDLSRKAMQIGMNGEILKKFGTEWILQIEDITPFVTEQRQILEQGRLKDLMLPYEEILQIEDEMLAKYLQLES